jgi:Fe-S cluster assembly iron-binding protein IscA
MLTITPAASAAIVDLLHSPEIPAGAGLRLTHQPAGPDSIAIGMAVVDEAEPDDAVLAAGDGAEVFVEPGTAELLDRQELDVDLEDDRVVFSFHPQGVNGGPPGGLM